MAGIWVLAENRRQTLELLNIGRDLASKLGNNLSVFLWHDRELAREYIAYGADEVILLPPLPEGYPFDAYVSVIAEEARKQEPDIFLVAATFKGREAAARIAARLNTGLCSECISLNLDEKSKTLEMERLIFGGMAVQRLICKTRPQMATVPPGTFEPAVEQGEKEGRIRDLPAPPPPAVRVLDKKAKVHGVKDIKEAKVIVCAGRGVEKEEDMSLIRELAEVLGGEVACTRPISEEMHWLPENLCIGLSGKSVKPDLYIGVGVSGQIQHVTGIRDAKVICAINNDENAPIFEVADYGITGDLYKVVPRLIQELKSKRQLCR